jgi:hypothetical protein
VAAEAADSESEARALLESNALSNAASSLSTRSTGASASSASALQTDAANRERGERTLIGAIHRFLAQSANASALGADIDTNISGAPTPSNSTDAAASKTTAAASLLPAPPALAFRSYACPVARCGRAFAAPSHLREHYATAHIAALSNTGVAASAPKVVAAAAAAAAAATAATSNAIATSSSVAASASAVSTAATTSIPAYAAAPSSASGPAAASLSSSSSSLASSARCAAATATITRVSRPLGYTPKQLHFCEARPAECTRVFLSGPHLRRHERDVHGMGVAGSSSSKTEEEEND